MFLKRITLVLALLLTMFAVSAKAITCSPEPAECTGLGPSLSGSITVQFIGPGGTEVCHFNFCYCFECPVLPDTVIKIHVWSIEQVDGCPDIDMGLVYDKIREDVVSGDHIMKICGPLPSCLPLPSHYKYVEYSTAACWHAVTINEVIYHKPCPGCTARCIWLYRYCFVANSIFMELFSNTLVGNLDCDYGCENYSYLPGGTPPPTFGDCYHVCQ